MYKIVVSNRAQQILLECELKGQISDGAWENSKPNNHWQKPTSAQVVVSEDGKIGLNWYHSRKYDFVQKMLLDVVGDRMTFWVKFYTAFPQLSMEDHWSYDLSDGWPKYEGEYWDKKRAKIKTDTRCDTLEEIMAKVNAVAYGRKQLVQDLKGLKTVFGSVLN